jgi:hypothetical protein
VYDTVTGVPRYMQVGIVSVSTATGNPDCGGAGNYGVYVKTKPKKKDDCVCVSLLCFICLLWCLFIYEILISSCICLLSDFGGTILHLHSRRYGRPRRAHSFRSCVHCAVHSRADFFSLFVINKATKKLSFLLFVSNLLFSRFQFAIAISCESFY